MAERIKFLIQKRTSLRSQITNVSNMLDRDRLDNATLKLRIERLKTLFHNFEEYNDELFLLEPDKDHETEFVNVQERFYALAGRVENMINATNVTDRDIDPIDEDAHDNVPKESTPPKRRRIKLPEAPLPTFDGKYENWLSFKNSFQSMVMSQTDLDDVDKLMYLKASLRGEAANKISIFAIDGTDFPSAWALLERSYEVRRVLVSRHLARILNMPALERETSGGLSKLADDTQQHIAALNALNVSVGSEMIIHIIESKLPKLTADRWEASLEWDKFPTLDQLYEFLYKSAVYASKRERSSVHDREKGKCESPVKKRRVHSTNRVFLANATRACVACKSKRHPLFVCDTFKQWPVEKRIETVRMAKVCYNCLRSHRDAPCRFSNCTICQKRHNTLLHSDSYASTSRSNTSKPVAANNE